MSLYRAHLRIKSNVTSRHRHPPPQRLRSQLSLGCIEEHCRKVQDRECGTSLYPESPQPSPESRPNSDRQAQGHHYEDPRRPGPRTAMPAAFRYALTVSRRTPVCCPMRRKDQPRRPSTMICYCFSSFNTLLMAREPKRLRYAVNVPNASTVGRFWVITEDRLNRIRII